MIKGWLSKCADYNAIAVIWHRPKIAPRPENNMLSGNRNKVV